jgi:hypothetical protein
MFVLASWVAATGLAVIAGRWLHHSAASTAARCGMVVVVALAWFAGFAAPALGGAPAWYGFVASEFAALVGLGAAAVSLIDPRDRRSVGVATLRPRGPLDHVTRYQLGWATAGAGLAIVALLVTGATGNPDPIRSSATLTYQPFKDGEGWPGWSVGIPALVGLAIIVLASLAVLRFASSTAPPADRRLYDHLRIAVGRIVVAMVWVAGLGVLGTALVNVGLSFDTHLMLITPSEQTDLSGYLPFIGEALITVGRAILLVAALPAVLEIVRPIRDRQPAAVAP